MTWPIAIATSVVPTEFGPLLFSGRLNEALRAAAEFGFQGIEISMGSPGEIDAAALERLLQTHGLRLAALGSGRAFLEEGLSLSDVSTSGRQQAVQRIRILTDYGSVFGAPVIVGLMRGRRAPGDDPSAVFDRLRESMRLCANHAVAAGMTLLVEAINRYETNLLNTALETVHFVQGLEMSNVYVLLDAFHMNIEESSPSDAIRATGRYLGHFHVADSNRRAPGMGHIDHSQLLTALAEIGYGGWLSAEVLPLPTDLAAAQQVQAYSRSLLFPAVPPHS